MDQLTKNLKNIDMKKIISLINLLLVALLLGGTVMAQESQSYDQDFAFWWDQHEEIETTAEYYKWRVISDQTGANLEWNGYTTDLKNQHHMYAKFKKGVYNKSFNYLVFNPNQNDSLSTSIDHPAISGLSQLVIGSNNKDVEVFINGVSQGVYAGNNSTSPIVVDLIDVEGAFDLAIKSGPNGNPRVFSMRAYGWTPAKMSNATTLEDGMSMEMSLSEPLAAKDTTMYGGHGFSLEVNNADEDVEIEKVKTSADGSKLIVYFTKPTYRHHEVLISYDRAQGQLLSGAGNSLASFEEGLVTNNSPILPPLVLRPVETNALGDTVVITIDKEMKQFNFDHGSGFVVSGSVSGDIAIDSLYTNTDNTDQLVLLLATAASVDDVLTLDYSGDAIMSSDEGVLEAFSDFPLVNKMTGAKAELSVMPATDLLGEYIKLVYSKELNALPVGEESAFVIKVNGTERAVSTVELDANDAHIVNITLLAATIKTDDITVSYTGGTHTTVEDGALRLFTDEAVTNNSPGVPPLSLVAVTDSTSTKVIIDFEFNLGILSVRNIAVGDFVIDIVSADGTVVQDSPINFRVPIVIDELTGLPRFIAHKLEMEFTQPVLFTDNLHITYTGTALQGWDRGVVLPFDRVLHSQMAGADAHATQAELAGDLSSIFIDFTQDLDVNYVFDDHESTTEEAQQVNIDPADFMVSINDEENIHNKDILPTKRTFATFVSRYFDDENSLIVNLDLDFYKVTDWDTLTTQLADGQVEWMYQDSVITYVVGTPVNEEGSYNWDRVEEVTGTWVPQWDNLLEARTDTGLVNWSYNGVDQISELGTFITDTTMRVEFIDDAETMLLVDTVLVKDTTYVEWVHGDDLKGDTIIANFQAYMSKGDVSYNYGDTTIVSTNRSIPLGTLDLTIPINGTYTAVLDTAYLPTDSTSIDWYPGDDITLTYVPGANKIKTVEKPFDERLTIPDSMAIVDVQPVYDPVTFVISSPAEFEGSYFKDSVRTVDDAYWLLTVDYRYKAEGLRSGIVQPFSFNFTIPTEAVNEKLLTKDFITRPVEEDKSLVYPLVSPVKHTLAINNADGFTQIQIYSLTGQLMSHETLSGSYVDLPVGQMPKGLYIVVLSGSESRERFTGKIIKQ